MGTLARTNFRSLERALALRRMVIDRLQSPSGSGKFASIRSLFDSKGVDAEEEAKAARLLIDGLIERRGASADDTVALVRLDGRIDAAMTDMRRQLKAEIDRLLVSLDAGDAKATSDILARVDSLRDQLIQKLDSIRAD